jgi:hypothetical protein
MDKSRQRVQSVLGCFGPLLFLPYRTRRQPSGSFARMSVLPSALVLRASALSQHRASKAPALSYPRNATRDRRRYRSAELCERVRFRGGGVLSAFLFSLSTRLVSFQSRGGVARPLCTEKSTRVPPNHIGLSDKVSSPAGSYKSSHYRLSLKLVVGCSGSAQPWQEIAMRVTASAVRGDGGRGW